jgi:hypothetical protein
MENQKDPTVQPSRKARFLFNALVGTAFIVSGSLFGFLGLIGVLSIIGFPQGISLLLCSALLYVCGSRLLFGAFLDV